jgi:hypothetical protein
MILENYNQTALLGEGELQASADYIGDVSELSELTTQSLGEMHNLTIALARVEHKCLVENDQTLMEGAVGEFFKKAADTIKAWWNKFVAWLGSLWTKLKDVFVKREDWLKRNAAAISAVTDEQLKDVKVKVGANVGSTDFAGVTAKAIAEAKDAVGLASHLSKDAAADTRSFVEKAKQKMLSMLKGADGKKSVAKEIHDALIGESGEVQLTKSGVATFLKVAQDTFKAMDQMKGAKMVADAAVKEAEGMAKANGGEKEVVNARISYLREIGPQVQALISGFSSAISTANGQVMPVLVKVAGLGGKKEEKKDEKKDEKEPVNAATDVLAAFM